MRNTSPSCAEYSTNKSDADAAASDSAYGVDVCGCWNRNFLPLRLGHPSAIGAAILEDKEFAGGNTAHHAAWARLRVPNQAAAKLALSGA